MNPEWPSHLSVGAVRFARPTARYDAVVAFYEDALGLPVLGRWRGDEGHAGYDGVLIGLPGTPVHLEVTQHGSPPVIPEPHPENQLVLYMTGPDAVAEAAARMREHGHEPVEAANPYWPERGCLCFEDPDGWVVVLAPWVFGVDPVPRPAV
ncbi:VOC family protein [Yinghuangia seranimata]|uniref:VOC family protein n=1 Tax=Yinghuangia seranimata TaxID=408067 RepID=UPI00248C5412|nr:VOC family protein [Yinghuangia seranimata]MDI2130414.1 VOC family protein [Yinghuangia seranimata]